MVSSRPAAVSNTSIDDFQRAAAEAEAEAGQRAWYEMTVSEQTRAIYARLQRIDAARAALMSFNPGPHGRFRVAGERTKRVATA